jgi:glycosyltransferase involved in cell wall biosynthesis
LAQTGTIPEFALQIAGDGKAAYRAELEAHVAALGLGDTVRFLGFVSGESKVRALRETDVVVSPGYHENFGIAVVEAMAAGLPAIVSDGVALANEIEAADGGLVFPSGNVRRLASALRELLDREHWQRASDNARAFASGFSLEALGKDLVRAYRAAANEMP